MSNEKKEKRARRNHRPGFKVETVRLVREGGASRVAWPIWRRNWGWRIASSGTGYGELR